MQAASAQHTPRQAQAANLPYLLHAPRLAFCASRAAALASTWQQQSFSWLRYVGAPPAQQVCEYRYVLRSRVELFPPDILLAHIALPMLISPERARQLRVIAQVPMISGATADLALRRRTQLVFRGTGRIAGMNAACAGQRALVATPRKRRAITDEAFQTLSAILQW